MSHRPTEETSAERGAALMLSIVLIGVVGIVVVALLGLVLANFESTKVAQARADQRYAADAALEEAIESIRNDRTLCEPASSARPLAPLSVNGITVSVSCDAVAGDSPGAGGWAIIATATDRPGITRAGTGPLVVQGPVWAARLDDGLHARIEGGRVVERRSGPSCSSGADRPAGLTVTPDPPYRYVCADEPVPSVDHQLPAARPAAAPAPTTTNGCRVFYPGTYTTAPVLAPENRFVSGTYYFHDVGRLLVQGAEIAGGDRPDESRANTGTSACDVVGEPESAPGTGVKWIFGGTSWLEVGANADVELYSRLGGDPSEGQAGITVQAVTSPAPSGFTASARGLDAPLVAVTGGSSAQLAVHGMVYAPGSYVDFVASTSSQAQLRGGLVAGTVRLQGPATGGGLVVSP